MMVGAGVQAPRLPGEEELWRIARYDPTADARHQLFDAYAGFARKLAARYFRRRQGGVELQELQQLAYTGLLEAIDRFDPDIGAPFRAYAARRITGAILSGIAKMSELQHQISFRNRVRAERLRSLAPDAKDAQSAADALKDLADMAVGLALGFMLETGMVVEEGEADRRPNAYESLAWKDLLKRLGAEVAALPERERLIVQRHYLDGVEFAQLAAMMGLSKGRVSQIHRAALETVRSRLSSAGFN